MTPIDLLAGGAWGTAVLGGLWWVVARVQAQRRQRIVELFDAARRLGLEPPRAGLVGHPRVTGKVDGLPVSIVIEHRSKQGRFTVIEVDGTGRIPGTLALARMGLQGSLSVWLGGQDIRTGDDFFDDAVRVECDDEALARAVLDSSSRAALLTALTYEGVVVRRGRLRWESREWVGTHLAVKKTQELLDLARRLTIAKAQLPARLGTTLAGERLPGVRRALLRFLQDRYPGDAVTAAAARAGLDDVDPAVRLVAAAALGREALATVRALTGPEVPEAVRVEAIAALLRLGRRDEAGPVLLERVAPREPEAVRRAALAGLGKLRFDPAGPVLAELAPTESDPETATALAAALAAVGGKGAEAALLVLLEHPHDSVKASAARGLGRRGSLAAVEALLPHARGIASLGELGRAAREAVAAIQARAVGAEAGHVSLAGGGDPEGAVSLAGEGGEVSLEDGEEPPPG